ncbi:MAG: LacI family DNA-binding transcriptional regulator [Chloroflexi bacterium]|nr:LacI family DNA-binding transcriptional regulator [Chloroflexota bacterium]
MRDIAKAAGVPVSAVPLVLADKPGVSADRRARVRQAIEDLGYARPLGPGRQTRRHRLGLVIEGRGIPIFTDYYYGEILAGIQAEAKALRLAVWLHAFEPETETIDDVARAARDEVDGFVVVSGGDMTDERISLLERTGLPTVLVDNYIIGHDVHAVVADNYGAGYVATRHLLDLGHRRIGMIAGSRAYRKFVHRQSGYADALAEAGIGPDLSLMPPAHLSEGRAGEPRAGEIEMAGFLALPPDRRPTALVAANDRLAARALLVAHRAGVRVPSELSVVGIGDVDEATSTIPPLTTVSIPRREMGVLGVRRLVELLRGTAPTPQKTVLHTRLMQRESSGPAPE